MVEEIQRQNEERQSDSNKMDSFDQKVLTLAEEPNVEQSDVDSLAAQVIRLSELDLDRAGLLAHVCTTTFKDRLPEEIRQLLSNTADKARYKYPGGQTDQVMDRLNLLRKNIESALGRSDNGGGRVTVSSVQSPLGRAVLELEARRMSREYSALKREKSIDYFVRPIKTASAIGVIVNKISRN